jgi:hypothetical protein
MVTAGAMACRKMSPLAGPCVASRAGTPSQFCDFGLRTTGIASLGRCDREVTMPFDNPHQAPINDLEILIDARERISGENSWLKRCFTNEKRHCLVAALSLACGSRSFYAPSKTERRLARLLAKQLSPATPLRMRTRLMPARSRLMLFNDHRRTRQEDVVALFDRTICCLASKAPEFVPA